LYPRAPPPPVCGRFVWEWFVIGYTQEWFGRRLLEFDGDRQPAAPTHGRTGAYEAGHEACGP
jgi:hypothetical protein